MNNLRTLKNISGTVLKVRDLFSQHFRPDVVKFDDSRVISVGATLDLGALVGREVSQFSSGLDKALAAGYVVPASGVNGFYSGSSEAILADNLAANAAAAAPFAGPATKTDGAAVNPAGGVRTAVAQISLQNAGGDVDQFDDNIGVTLAVSGTATGKAITAVKDGNGVAIPGIHPATDLTKTIYFFKDGIINVTVLATSVGTLILTPVSFTADLTGAGVASGLADNAQTTTFS